MTKSKQLLVSKHGEQQEPVKEQKSKSKSKLPLEINLDEIKNPHPELVRTWKESGVQDQYMSFEDNPECNNEKRIFLYANASKPKAEIKHRIVSIYRKKDFGGREVCFFNEHLMTHDIFHNPLDHTRTVGRYQLPKIVPIMGYNPNATPDPSNPVELGPQATGAQIESVETVYEFEFEALKPQLIKWYKEGIIRDDCNFTAWVGQRKYSITDWDAFLNYDLESLVLLNKTDLDVMGLGLSKKEILEMAKTKAKEKLIENIGKHSAGTGRTGVRS